MSKRIRKHWGKITVATLCLMLVVGFTLLTVFWPTQKVQAALTKTTSVDVVDDWQEVAAGTLTVGNAEDVSGNYDTVAIIELALTDTDAQDGSGEVIVEISYGDDDWTKLVAFSIRAETPATTDVNDASSTAADAYMILVDSATGDFDVPGRKWMVVDGTVANSESFRTKSNANPDTVTLCQDTMRNHANSLACWDRVDEWAVSIPFSAAYYRVLVNDSDADADVHFTHRVLKTTALE